MNPAGYDLVASCLPQASTKKFVARYPDRFMPRARAMLAAEDIRQRRVVTTPVVKRLRA